MSDNKKNQKNKAFIWDFWQKMNHVGSDQIATVIQAAFHKDVNWNGPHPINQLEGVTALVTDFWQPLLRSFPNLKRNPYIFMGGMSGGEEWVSGVGYLTGTFAQDWLGIPATGKKTNIHFGQFYVMRDGKVSESYVIYDLLAVMRQAGFQILPPARGMEGGKIPGPTPGDGVLLTEQDDLETRQTQQLVMAMGAGMESYIRSRDGANMDTMEQEHYWDPRMHWYGPSGIGACLSLEEFQDFHQRPWLQGFGDRELWKTSGGRYMGPYYEGNYGCGGVWDTPFSKHHGEYLGVQGTEKLMTLRDFDWYRREGDRLMQNWVSIDMIDLLMQMGIDLFERLHNQVELRKKKANID
jgi:predicted ester cyclase